MAEKELRDLCRDIRQRWPVTKIALLHRVGVVDIGAASVVVAVSGVHRQEALESVIYGINTLKARVPI
eukprot:g1212.t1